MQIYNESNLETMKRMPDNSVDTIVTDPPYGLKFMGKHWDYSVPGVETFAELLRVTKPGALMLCFGGSRTFHRMAVNIEDAGWELRDTIMWLYGSGFPHGLDIQKASSSEDWSGYNTNLKPAFEPVIICMKPLDGTFAENALKWGVAGFAIYAARIGTSSAPRKDPNNGKLVNAHMDMRPWMKRRIENGEPLKADFPGDQGRYPSNVILDEAAAEMLDEQSDSASRFYYCAKSSQSERNAGLDGIEERQRDLSRNADQKAMNGGEGNPYNRGVKPVKNHHSTVKPLSLMRYLVKLTKTPTGGTVYDPFMGSGTTGMACTMEGRDFIGSELDSEYCEIAKRRIEWAEKQHELETAQISLFEK